MEFSPVFEQNVQELFCSLNNGQLDAALDDARADGVAGQAGGVT